MARKNTRQTGKPLFQTQLFLTPLDWHFMEQQLTFSQMYEARFCVANELKELIRFEDALMETYWLMSYSNYDEKLQWLGGFAW